jgi:hypothetical protein
MSLFRHPILCGVAACFVMACGSKEKEGEAAPDTAAETSEGAEESPRSDEDGPDAGAATKSGEADPAAERAKTLRERRAERLVRKAGEGAEEAAGPKVVRPARVGADLGKKPPLLPGMAPEAVTPGAAKKEKAEAATGGAPERPDAAADGVEETSDSAEATSGQGDAAAKEKPEDPAAGSAEAARARHEADKRAAAGRVALPSPDVARFLPLAVVSDLTQKKGLRDAGTLPGIAAVDGYGSIFYASPDKRFGVSLQAWADPSLRETEDRYRRMRLQHPSAEDVEALKPVKAYYSEFAGIQSLTVARPDKLMVLTISCGDRTCDHTALLKLAQSVQSRL